MGTGVEETVCKRRFMWVRQHTNILVLSSRKSHNQPAQMKEAHFTQDPGTIVNA